MTLAQDMGIQATIASLRHNQAYIALREGDVVRAIACLRESLVISRDIDNKDQMAWGLATLGGVVVTEGQAERGVWLLAAAEAQFTISNHVLPRNERAEHDRYIAAAHAQLSEAVFKAAWAAGVAMPIALATAQVLDELE